jgi:hypothetical protein
MLNSKPQKKNAKLFTQKAQGETLNIMYRGNMIMARGCLKTSVVDPDLVDLNQADPDRYQFRAHVFLTFFQ